MTIESRSSLDQLASRQLPSPPRLLEEAEKAELLAALPSGWRLEGDMLRRAFPRPDYASGVRLVVAIGRLADELNHHPELHLKWGELGFAVSTHDVLGISELDFILAAKVEQLATASS